VIRCWFERRPDVSKPGAPGNGLSALEILHRRYARGEIDAASEAFTTRF
jgi:uncharacterized membrane protein